MQKDPQKSGIELSSFTPAIKILNSDCKPVHQFTIINDTNQLPAKPTTTVKRHATWSPTKSPMIATPKKPKIEKEPAIIINIENTPTPYIDLEQFESNKSKIQSEVKVIKNTEQELEKPPNKLLALIEVTPDQYKELTQKLSASEQSSKVENLITAFLDNDDEHIDENGK